MSSIAEKLSSCAALTEAALEELLPKGDVKHSVVYDAMRYATLGGGKRIRPFLTLAFCELFGGDTTAALPYACAVEMVHSYSLIHDDLPCMDDDDMRRGRPTCHKVYGEAFALLAGDALLTYAFAACADNPFTTPAQNIRAISTLAAAAGHDGMIGGQICDLQNENAPGDVSFDMLLDTHRMKTGAIISAACTLGCIAADGDLFGADDENGSKRQSLTEADYAAARRYAYNIGLAFQVIDDILGAIGDEAKLGKPVGRDESRGKTTILSFMSIDEAREFAQNLTNDAISAVSSYHRSEMLIELAKWLLTRDK